MHKGWGWSCKRFTELPRIFHGSPTACYGTLRTGLCMKRLPQGLVLWLFFNPQTLSVSVCSRSVADPLRSINSFRDIFLSRKHQGCQGCHKDIQDGYMDNKDSHGRATDEIRKSYGYQLQIWSAKPLWKNLSSLIFLWHPHGIRIGSHKDITDVTDGRTGRKDDL